MKHCLQENTLKGNRLVNGACNLQELYHSLLDIVSYQMLQDNISYLQHPKTDEAMNTAFYHYYFKSADKDAMGSSGLERGYSDS